MMNNLLSKLFPQQNIFSKNLSPAQALIVFFLLTIIFSMVASLIPQDGFFAFDWIHFFGIGNIPIFYPPWTKFFISILTYPILVGLTLAAVGIASYLRAIHPISMMAVFFSLPVLWTIFLGQLDGLVVLGTLCLPWLAPLALIKPQLSLWAFGSRKEYILALLLTFLTSLSIWGWWPTDIFSVWTIHEEGKYVNDISIGLAGLPVALVLFWFSRGDIDMLMASGAFITPYLLPYNLIVLTPAIARLSPLSSLIACVLSWLPLSANWLGDQGWWLGWLFLIWLWAGLACKRYNVKNKFSLSSFLKLKIS
ncbi:MAG: hypothetical protein KatS3mg045_0080 [Bellilinea sp.]|nr:MAG: hypothetical protein KatS3mg045_0080 [Bellilinea sp.]